MKIFGLIFAGLFALGVAACNPAANGDAAIQQQEQKDRDTSGN